MRYFTLFAFVLLTCSLSAQEAHRRWRKMNQIRNDKFDLVLPEVLRENNIDMWIVICREGRFDPLYPNLGEGSIKFCVYPNVHEDRKVRSKEVAYTWEV